MTGQARPVVIVGDPVLHEPAARVTEFDSELSRLIDDMFATMYLAEGVGLAATQVGVGMAVFVYDCHDDEDAWHKGHVVNPVIRSVSRDLDKGDEGCRGLGHGVNRSGMPAVGEGFGATPSA